MVVFDDLKFVYAIEVCLIMISATFHFSVFQRVNSFWLFSFQWFLIHSFLHKNTVGWVTSKKLMNFIPLFTVWWKRRLNWPPKNGTIFHVVTHTLVC